jgi:hypothetical protein
MWHAQVHAIVFNNAWKVCFVIFSVQDFYQAFGCVMCTLWFLVMARIKLKCSGNARFELQIVDVSHGQEDVINGDGPFFEVNTAPIPCKVCLPMIRSYNGFGPPLGYSTISGCRRTFFSKIVNEGELNFIHLFCFKGAIGSAPWLCNSPIYNGNVLIRSFF